MRFLPHLLTSGNLFCGAVAIVQLSNGRLLEATWLVFVAGLLDFFDGFAARWLKVDGDFGKQLDSLADVITFGLVPAFMLHIIATNITGWPFAPAEEREAWYAGILRYTPLLIAVFSGLRLAKFNLDTRQTTSFIGVPTPSNAFWICGLPYLMKAYPALITSGWISPLSIALLAILSCVLLVAPITLLSLKIKSLAWPGNETRYLLLLSLVISFVLLKFAALLLFVPLYILFSILHNRLYNNEIHS